jgi:hypothetical protein
VAHGKTKWENISKQEIMLLLKNGGRRLEPHPFMQVIRSDDGVRGLMGKIQKYHGTVEDASQFLDSNRERVITLHKKRESKQQRICNTISRNIKQPT